MEIVLVLVAILIVAIVGLIVTKAPIEQEKSFVGHAIQIDTNNPTERGLLEIMNNLCAPIKGTGDCNTICGDQKVCVPVENNCDANIDSNQCLCCDMP